MKYLKMCQRVMQQAVKQVLIYLMMQNAYFKAKKYLLICSYSGHKIRIHESRPIQLGGYFHSIIPYPIRE